MYAMYVIVRTIARSALFAEQTQTALHSFLLQNNFPCTRVTCLLNSMYTNSQANQLFLLHGTVDEKILLRIVQVRLKCIRAILSDGFQI